MSESVFSGGLWGGGFLAGGLWGAAVGDSVFDFLGEFDEPVRQRLLTEDEEAIALALLLALS